MSKGISHYTLKSNLISRLKLDLSCRVCGTKLQVGDDIVTRKGYKGTRLKCYCEKCAKEKLII